MKIHVSFHKKISGWIPQCTQSVWLAYFKLAQALQAASIQDSEVHTPAPHPPPERLQCAACHIPIVTPTGTVDADHFPVLWRLAHCRHPLHLDCLAPLGHPYAISRVMQRPNYVHNPGSYFSLCNHHYYVNNLTPQLPPESEGKNDTTHNLTTAQSHDLKMPKGWEHGFVLKMDAAKSSSLCSRMVTGTPMCMVWLSMATQLVDPPISDAPKIFQPLFYLSIKSFFCQVQPFSFSLLMFHVLITFHILNFKLYLIR